MMMMMMMMMMMLMLMLMLMLMKIAPIVSKAPPCPRHATCRGLWCFPFQTPHGLTVCVVLLSDGGSVESELLHPAPTGSDIVFVLLPS